jgi:FtsP/CotA-like multicopper oxidase with cupredoxin domain
MKLTVTITAAVPFLLPLLAKANPGNQIAWEPCDFDSNILCGDIEFCQSGSNVFGYRRMGDGSACGSNNGPLIRFQKGQKYQLTLHNTASVVTNMHTHGLHVVGAGFGDDVTRHVGPNECLDYSYDIGANHPPGTHWYHPHYHGLTNDQVSGGAHGMVIVEDDDTTYLDSWAYNELLLHVVDSGNTVTGNGLSNPSIYISANKWYRLRVLTVSPGAKVADLTFGGLCRVFKVASDGVWHTMPFDTYTGSVFEQTGASRGDYAINCDVGEAVIEWNRRDAATLVITSNTIDPVYDTVPPGEAPPRPYSLSGIVGTSTVSPANMHAIAISAAAINGESWNADVPLKTIAWDEVHEFSISSSAAHPFHLHLYHMQVMTPGGCGIHKQYEFYDTIAGSCDVRFKTADFGQRLVMHCHVLSHEDNGAMVWMDVAGSGMPSYLGGGNGGACPDGTSPTDPPTEPPADPPTEPPTDPPTEAPTDPPPPPVCLGNKEVCSQHDECCSNKCNGGSCKGNRLRGRF